MITMNDNRIVVVLVLVLVVCILVYILNLKTYNCRFITTVKYKYISKFYFAMYKEKIN